MTSKICSICGLEKPLSEFSKRKDSKDGYRGQCRMCLNLWEKRNDHRWSNPDLGRIIAKRRKDNWIKDNLKGKSLRYLRNLYKTMSSRSVYFPLIEEEFARRSTVIATRDSGAHHLPLIR